MNRIDWALGIFVAESRGNPLILVRSVGGLPEAAVPSHPILKVSYLSQAAASSEHGIESAQQQIQAGHPLLLLTMPSADGPPSRSGVVFRYKQTNKFPWTDGRNGKPDVEADEYLAAVSLDQYPWGFDLRAGRPGYFLTGISNVDNLWRIVRVEADIAGRQLFTLFPIKLATSLPDVDFSPIANELIRQKLERDWSEVERCLVAHLYSSLITAAKNVVESLMLYSLGDESKLTLNEGLRKLRSSLDGRQDSIFTELDYHLMSKLRILHGLTHSDRVIISGRLVTPEFALTVATDLVEVLRSSNLLRS